MSYACSGLKNHSNNVRWHSEIFFILHQLSDYVNFVISSRRSSACGDRQQAGALHVVVDPGFFLQSHYGGCRESSLCQRAVRIARIHSYHIQTS
jgi:hypothetical protein